jgi:hypothetical protein
VTQERVMAWLTEGVGLPPAPLRHPGHEHVQWFELDLDDEFDDPDEAFVDPLPTERHRSVPD